MKKKNRVCEINSSAFPDTPIPTVDRNVARLIIEELVSHGDEVEFNFTTREVEV